VVGHLSRLESDCVAVVVEVVVVVVVARLLDDPHAARVAADAARALRTATLPMRAERRVRALEVVSR
jgi:hypothetical protein